MIGGPKEKKTEEEKSSGVDPDGYENFSRIRIREKSFQIRIRHEFEVKLLWKTDKIWQFLNKKILKIKIQIPFYLKNP